MSLTPLERTTLQRGDITPDVREYPLGEQTQIKVAPDPVISVNTAKNWVRQKSNKDNDDLESLITETMGKIQRYLGKAVGEQTLVTMWDWAGDFVDIPYPPTVSIEKITKIDTANNGEESEVDASDYWVEGLDKKRIHFKQYLGMAVKVEYKTGTVNVKSAIKTELGTSYKNRGDADQPAPPIDVNSGLSLPALAELSLMRKGSL